MLSIEIDGEWVQTDDRSLIELILEGRAEELSPARDAEKSLAACPLIEFLQPSQLETLLQRIVQRLPGMYVTGPDSTDFAALLERVRALRRWNWADHLTKGRLDWLEGWLSELAGVPERAVKAYDSYLRGLAQEPPFRLLALNNRGVQRILLRQAEGVRDFAAAAVPVEGGSLTEGTQLPAACFNLLNLLTHALNRHPLCDQVEDVLVDFMVKLPRRVREYCLGPDPLESRRVNSSEHSPRVQSQDASEEAIEAGPPSSARGRSPEEDEAEGEVARSRLRKRLRILKDPSFVRLTHLMIYLADEAPGVAPAADGACTLEAVAAQLQLWTVPPAGGSGTGRRGDAPDGPRARQNPLDRYAEAASLLYTSDIPASLVPGDGSISWVRQYTDKAMALAEEYCATADFRLAESTLTSLLDSLDQSRGDPLIETVAEDISQRLEEVRRRATAHEQFDLYQTCTDLVGRVREFCSRTDLCQAEFDADLLKRRVMQAQERLATVDVSDGEALSLLRDLPERIQRHLDRLRREDVERRIVKPREQLRATCPQDWREPVCREAYEALRRCQVNDPECLVEDWRGWRLRLDKHQARYHFRLALAEVTEGGIDSGAAQEMLAQALGFDPGLTPASAPLHCVLALRKLENPPEDLVNTKADILKTARELLEMEPLGSESLWSPAVRAGLVQEACVLLERLIQAYHGVGAELEELWQALEKGFAPAFAEAPPQVLREILAVVETCLKACPVHNAGKLSCIDPRNRLHVLQQTCKKFIQVAEGEEALCDGRLQDARDSLGRVIDLLSLEGLTGDQDVQLLRRAVCGWYLSSFREQDPAHVQRRTLDDLDRWIDQFQGGDGRVDCQVEYVERIIAGARGQTLPAIREQV